ncbi:oxidoreductase NAD-binding domain protein [Ancylostoma caninum]|uniref:cytochrome-b5 reductase n=1 Tax=Ancylostoma caninum TaxID=29170 RepID=A0A368H262_ANCCA|nr:oxidoreductase NAD-binding domain protein [Ancylostoma caninum]
MNIRSPDGKGLSRPYTPTRVTSTYFEIPIKIYEGGRLTRHIRDWKVGDNIEWRGSYNENIYWMDTKISHLLLVAGGTGIAPFIRIVEDVLKDEDTETRIRLVYCVRSAADVLFKDQLVEWARHWNVIIVICGVGVEDSLPILFERVDARLTEDVFQQQLEALTGGDLQEALVSVCGRVALEKDVVNFATRAALIPCLHSEFGSNMLQLSLIASII